jgi:integrin alpha FG-GAP repeat containing protein 1
VVNLLALVVFFSLFEGGGGSIFWNPWRGKAPQFRDEGFHRVSVGLDNVNGYVTSLADLDGDKYVDVLVVTEEKKRIVAHIWDHEEFEFVDEDDYDIVVETEIVSTITSDFNYDGRMDILVLRRAAAGQGEALIMDLFVINEKSGGSAPGILPRTGSEITYAGEVGRSIGTPLLLDYDGDMRVDLLGVSNSTGLLTLWRNDGAGTFTASNPGLDFAVSGSSGNSIRLASGHSNAFVDLDGDCTPDLVMFVESPKNQQPMAVFFRGNGNGGFSKYLELLLPMGSSEASFADLDADGNIDFVVPVCYPKDTCADESSLHIYYNRQPSMCSDQSILSNSGSDSCRAQSSLCSSRAFSFDEQPSSHHLVVALGQTTMRPLNPNPRSAYRVKPRFGDIDLDGYPDLLLTLEGRSVVFVSTSTDNGTGRRTFSRRSGGVYSSLDGFSHALVATFFDLDESGLLDILVVTASDNEQHFAIHFLFNNLFLDAFFLKSVGLNGKCAKWCSDGPRFPSPKPYGVNLPGVTTKLTVTTLHGDRLPLTGCQLPQSSPNALLPPYALLGLGRTNNYIEHFFMGMPNGRHRQWNGLMPNSQVIAITDPPTDDAVWELELFISPSEVIHWVIATLGLVLLLLVWPIALLRRREKEEDRKEKERIGHVFFEGM